MDKQCAEDLFPMDDFEFRETNDYETVSENVIRKHNASINLHARIASINKRNAEVEETAMIISKKSKEVRLMKNECSSIEKEEEELQVQNSIKTQLLSNSHKLKNEKQKLIQKLRAETEPLLLQKEMKQKEALRFKQELKDKYEALKYLLYVYKSNLDYNIRITKEEDINKVLVYFFLSNNAEGENYYVKLLWNEEQWTVESISPNIEFDEDCHLPEKPKISDFMKFFTRVREKFLKEHAQIRDP